MVIPNGSICITTQVGKLDLYHSYFLINRIQYTNSLGLWHHVLFKEELPILSTLPNFCKGYFWVLSKFGGKCHVFLVINVHLTCQLVQNIQSCWYHKFRMKKIILVIHRHKYAWKSKTDTHQRKETLRV